jgi:hypothetical protein
MKSFQVSDLFFITFLSITVFCAVFIFDPFKLHHIIYYGEENASKNFYNTFVYIIPLIVIVSSLLQSYINYRMYKANILLLVIYLTFLVAIYLSGLVNINFILFMPVIFFIYSLTVYLLISALKHFYPK